MTAIKATFSDFKLIKTRKIAQLVLEVPIEQANAALAALGGVPQFDQEQWVGVAPLNGEATSQPAPRKEMTRAQWAGMLCQDSQFQEFVDSTFPPDAPHSGPRTPFGISEFVRNFCNVESRSQINTTNPEACNQWDILKNEFDAWRGRIGRPE